MTTLEFPARPRTLCRLAAAVLLVLGGAGASTAQDASGVYATAGLLGDVKRFSGDPDSNNRSGETTGLTAGIGVAVARQWDLEVNLELPRTTEVVRERTIMLRLSRLTVQSITRNRASTASALVRFRPGSPRRVQLGYVAGLSFVKLREEFETRALQNVQASLFPVPDESVRYAAAPTVGAEARISLGRHVSVVPAFHATAFSAQDTSGILLRPRVSVRWGF